MFCNRQPRPTGAVHISVSWHRARFIASVEPSPHVGYTNKLALDHSVRLGVCFHIKPPTD